MSDDQINADSTGPTGGERDAARSRLHAEARQLPQTPGVYLMKDPSGEVLYVGKASSLRDRVSSYFLPSTDLGPRKQPLLAKIDSFEIIETIAEWEALLAEARLIKDLRPRFNVMLTDDKSYPYLAVTTRDDFPGVFVTRDPADPRYRGARIFGPFTSGRDIREAVDVMQRIFRFRTCHLDIKDGDKANTHFRPCLLHAIRQCTAPCADRISSESYAADIQRLLRFIGSKRSAVIRDLRAQMQEAAAGQRYEQAAALRDQLRSIERLGERAANQEDARAWQPEVTVFATDPSAALRSLQRTLSLEEPLRCIEAIDIAHLAGNETVGAKVCFLDGKPFKDQYRRYRITTASNDDYASIREVVSRRYADAGRGRERFPDVILIDGGQGQLNAALAAFGAFPQQPPIVVGLAKKEELIWIQDRPVPLRLGRENPGLKLCQAIRDEAHRFAQAYHHLLRSKRLLEE
ncbi:MAG: excinuclease ABC subunit UvrC [Planctomycetes bacterium]|nr:excinuclease ABC subunit UvrC [Planctomycetota bacterium]MCP4839624.1 excinuclease ABC subunit UvrC [Planctomycetota bacterium]